MVKWLVIAIALAGCRDAYNLTLPIDVIAGATWTDAQRADLANAAACWSLAFGVHYAPTATADVQRVTVAFNELLCLNPQDWGLTTTGFESNVTLCTDDFVPTPIYVGALFGVLTHELGHVAGIPVEVDDATSIMGGTTPISLDSRIGDPIFSAVDRELFTSDNPDFVQQPMCDPVVTASDAADDDFVCACP